MKLQINILPTEKASNIHLVPAGEYDGKGKLLKEVLFFCEKSEFGYPPQFIYLTQKEAEIKAGDWIMWCGMLYQQGFPKTFMLKDGEQKIIATNDPDLLWAVSNIPSIQESDLQYIADLWNKGDREVEVWDIEQGACDKRTYIPKLNLDGHIMIKREVLGQHTIDKLFGIKSEASKK